MNIVVLVKQVPDTYSERTLRPADAIGAEKVYLAETDLTDFLTRRWTCWPPWSSRRPRPRC